MASEMAENGAPHEDNDFRLSHPYQDTSDYHGQGTYVDQGSYQDEQMAGSSPPRGQHLCIHDPFPTVHFDNIDQSVAAVEDQMISMKQHIAAQSQDSLAVRQSLANFDKRSSEQAKGIEEAAQKSAVQHRTMQQQGQLILVVDKRTKEQATTITELLRQVDAMQHTLARYQGAVQGGNLANGVSWEDQETRLLVLHSVAKIKKGRVAITDEMWDQIAKDNFINLRGEQLKDKVTKYGDTLNWARKLREDRYGGFFKYAPPAKKSDRKSAAAAEDSMMDREASGVQEQDGDPAEEEEVDLEDIAMKVRAARGGGGGRGRGDRPA